MKNSLQEALKNVDMTYKMLEEIADDIYKPYSTAVDNLIKETDSNIENITNDQLRKVLSRLTALAFSFGDTKSKSMCVSKVSEALKKEAYAREVTLGEGSVSNRESNATLNTANNLLAEIVKDLISDSFKTKLDEIHRAVDTYKTILITRTTESKLSTNSYVGE